MCLDNKKVNKKTQQKLKNHRDNGQEQRVEKLIMAYLEVLQTDTMISSEGRNKDRLENRNRE